MHRRVLMAHPHSELYGSDRMFCESVRALHTADCEVVVTLPAPGPILGPLRDLGVQTVICPVPVLRKTALRPAGLARMLAQAVSSLRPAVRLVRDVRPDAIYLSTVVAPGWAVLATALRRPLLVHVHEAEDRLPRTVQIGLALPLLLADLVVANSQATARTVGDTIPRLRRRTRVVYNGVDGPPAGRARAPGSDAPGSDAPGSDAPAPAQPRLTVIGRLSPRKGTDLAVAACALLRERGRPVTLRLVGSIFPGYEWYEDELRAQVSREGIEPYVRFCGFDSDVWSVYADTDIALVPSRDEPFGNTSIEAQLAGVPVVVTDAQGLPETADGGRTATVVRSDDAAALADAVEALLDDWPAALRRAELARGVAAERFAPKRYRDEIATAVRSISRPAR